MTKGPAELGFPPGVLVDGVRGQGGMLCILVSDKPHVGGHPLFQGAHRFAYVARIAMRAGRLVGHVSGCTDTFLGSGCKVAADDAIDRAGRAAGAAVCQELLQGGPREHFHLKWQAGATRDPLDAIEKEGRQEWQPNRSRSRWATLLFG